MQIHQLKPTHKRKNEKRVGRGGKRGKYSGRGIKGQKSRAGKKLKPIIRDILKKYPKLRGYKFKTEKEYEIINLEKIEKYFKEGEKVNPDTLVEKGLMRKKSGKIPKVKILGRGEVNKKLIFEGCKISRSAKEKIEKAGGYVVQTIN
jgi:large subunit ribosomal protein L15